MVLLFVPVSQSACTRQKAATLSFIHSAHSLHRIQ